MKFSAQQIAALIGAEIDGNQEVEVNNLAKIEEGKEGDLCFLANLQYEEHLYTTEASIVLIPKSLELKRAIKDGVTLLKIENPYEAFAKLMEFYDRAQHPEAGVSSTAVVKTDKIGENTHIGDLTFVGNNVTIGNNCVIYPQVYIGDNTTIGDNTVIYPGVKVYHACKIGNHCTIHSGSIIGADGFGFAPNSDNEYNKIPQIGNVILEDRVEIGANTCIDRATMGSTVIGKGTKLDNLIQVGHNVSIGTNSVMAAQVGIAGSTKIGNNVMFAGQVGVNGHIAIADGTIVGAQSGIASNIKRGGKTWLGSPVVEADQMKKMYMAYRRLPQILEDVRRLTAELDT